MSITVEAYDDENGRVGGLMIILNEVTEQVKARLEIQNQKNLLLDYQARERALHGNLLENEARFRKLADSMPQIVWTARAGAKLDIAGDGYHGVNMALTNDYDVILMDVQMPHMDGHDATRTLRDKGCTVPIIALTAHAMKEERTRAVQSGFTEFLTKPIHRETFIEMILRFKPPS